MVKESVIIPMMVNKIRFTAPTGFVRFYDADLETLPLNIRYSEPDKKIFINDRLGVAWGEPISLTTSDKDSSLPFTVNFKLTTTLEIWNQTEVMKFDRLTSEKAKTIRYVQFKNAVNDGDTLLLSVPRPEEMASQIATHVSMKRLDKIEALLRTA